MAITKAGLRAAAQILAQDQVGAAGGTGVQLLTTSTTDYDAVINMALRLFCQDVPNLRVKDVTVAATGFLFTLVGSGAILGTDQATDSDAWVDGSSAMMDVWLDYSDSDQGGAPIEGNSWRVRNAPSKILLELLGRSAQVGTTMRLEFTAPHFLHESDATKASVKPGTWDALVTLTASQILQIAATRMVQNTGNTGLPNDIVDRRSQSDIMRSRAKELFGIYGQMVGRMMSSDGQAGVVPASGFKDLDVTSSMAGGLLWHPTSRR